LDYPELAEVQGLIIRGCFERLVQVETFWRTQITAKPDITNLMVVIYQAVKIELIE